MTPTPTPTVSDIPVLRHYPLGPRLTAFSTLRQGGVSAGPYASLNINPYCGDRPEHVAANRQRLCAHLGIADDRLVVPHQTHGDTVRLINHHFFSLPPTDRQPLLEGVDALMTDLPGICIGVSTADCIPLLLYDPCHHAVCAVHAGWRGTLARIAAKAVSRMEQQWGSQPAHLQAVVGPGISQESFEVGPEVYEAFCAARFPMSLIARRYPARSAAASGGDTERWHLDLPGCNVLQLQEVGLAAEHIEHSPIDTFTHTSHYFSARRLGIRSGRIFTGAVLR